MNMVNTKHNTTEDMINKLQKLEGKTKIKLYENIGNSYDNMNIRLDDDPFAKNAQCISKIFHAVLKLMRFLQTKHQVKNMNIFYYDLYCTVIKNRKEKEIVDDQYENDFISLNDVIIPNKYVGFKPREIILRWRKMKSLINHFK